MRQILLIDGMIRSCKNKRDSESYYSEKNSQFTGCFSVDVQKINCYHNLQLEITNSFMCKLCGVLTEWCCEDDSNRKDSFPFREDIPNKEVCTNKFISITNTFDKV